MTKVAVVGAGLAGLYASYSAASHGAEVTLIEKSTIGTRHNCGEMFTETYTTAPEECKISRVEKFIVHIDGENIEFDFGELSPFVMTDKCFHERIMKNKCALAGVDIKEMTKSTKDMLVERKVIDASGVSNYIGNKGKAVDYEVFNKWCADLTPNTAFFIIRQDLMGYKWRFHKVHSINIGEGVYDKDFRCNLENPGENNIIFSGGGALPMPTMLEYVRNVELGHQFVSGIKVGNALGLVNPLLGGGEHLAVISGMLAGELVAKENEINYYRALNEIIGDEMHFGISMYEFLKKQEIESVKKILRSNLKPDTMLLNKTVRDAMRKWITIPEVKEQEVKDFVEG